MRGGLKACPSASQAYCQKWMFSGSALDCGGIGAEGLLVERALGEEDALGGAQREQHIREAFDLLFVRHCGIARRDQLVHGGPDLLHIEVDAVAQARGCRMIGDAVDERVLLLGEHALEVGEGRLPGLVDAEVIGAGRGSHAEAGETEEGGCCGGAAETVQK